MAMTRINPRNNKEQDGSKYLLISFLLGISPLGKNLLTMLSPLDFNVNKYVSSAYFCVIIISIMFFLPAIHTFGKERTKSQISGLCIAGSVIYIAINFIAGVFLKNIAASPYDISPKGIFINIVTLLPEIIALIMARSYIVNAVNRKTKHPIFWIVVVSLYFAVLQFNLTKLSIINNTEDLFIYFAKDIMPEISLSFLMSIICLVGGSIPCIYYMCINKIFLFIFPFLPTLSWFIESVIGIVYPIIFAMSVWEEYKIKSHKKPSLQKENVLSFMATLAVLVTFSWFLVGVFPIYPSVILTGSMEPLIYPGDVALIRKFKSEEEIYKLKEGDVINFKIENITIIHRIEKIESDEAGNLSFITKGDNNDSHDNWVVLPNDLNGTIEKIVPKVGLPVFLIHSNNNIPEGVSEY